MMHRSGDNVNQSGGAAAGGADRPARDDDDLLELVHRVMHLARSRQLQVLRGGAHELTPMESRVLGYFGRHAGATQSDLVAHSGRDKAQLARLIKSLRERGLLDGAPDADDRRQVRLRPTDAGRAVLQELQRQRRRVAAAAVAGLGAAEQATLRDLLAKVRDNLTG